MKRARASGCAWGRGFDKTTLKSDLSIKMRDIHLSPAAALSRPVHHFLFLSLQTQTTAHHTNSKPASLLTLSPHHPTAHSHPQFSKIPPLFPRKECITFRIRILSLLWWVHQWLILSSCGASFLEFRTSLNTPFSMSPFRPSAHFLGNLFEMLLHGCSWHGEWCSFLFFFFLSLDVGLC